MKHATSFHFISCYLNEIGHILKGKGKIKRATRAKYEGRWRNRNLSRSKQPREESVNFAGLSTNDPRPSDKPPSTIIAMNLL